MRSKTVETEAFGGDNLASFVTIRDGSTLMRRVWLTAGTRSVRKSHVQTEDSKMDAVPVEQWRQSSWWLAEDRLHPCPVQERQFLGEVQP